MRPDTIDQVIPAIVEHDAVSSHTFEAQRLLREMGFSSEIYARIIGPGAEGRVKALAELPRRDDGSQWLLYQSSIGSPAADVFARHPGGKLLDYHNITPASLVERWIPPLGDEIRLGRSQLGELAPLVPFAFADSSFNASELTDAGFARVSVVPLLVEPGNVEVAPDETTCRRLDTAKGDGGADWLFVGQLAPHKGQHDLVKAFACYRKLYDPNARLHLVGREMGNAYRDALRGFLVSSGLASCVTMPGVVSSEVLAAYYASADVFVCCSSHEGFCATIVEAMHRGLPVVAYATAAIPETLGDAGILVPEKDPLLVASAVREVLVDRTVHGELARAGTRRASYFSLEAARKAFCGAIDEALDALAR